MYTCYLDSIGETMPNLLRCERNETEHFSPKWTRFNCWNFEAHENATRYRSDAKQKSYSKQVVASVSCDGQSGGQEKTLFELRNRSFVYSRRPIRLSRCCRSHHRLAADAATGSPPFRADRAAPCTPSRRRDRLRPQSRCRHPLHLNSKQKTINKHHQHLHLLSTAVLSGSISFEFDTLAQQMTKHVIFATEYPSRTLEQNRLRSMTSKRSCRSRVSIRTQIDAITITSTLVVETNTRFTLNERDVSESIFA